MEVTTKERESENSIINGCLAVVNCLAMFYLINKYALIGKLVAGYVHSENRVLVRLLIAKDKLANSFLFFEVDLLLYLLLLGLILYGVMTRGKSDLVSSKQRANINLGIAILSFVLLQFSNLFFLDIALLFGLILCFIRGANMHQSVIYVQPQDQFNTIHQSFPQTEKLIEAPNSINLAYDYFYKGWRRGYINMLASIRGTLVLGTAGSGKTASILVPALWQSIYKGQSGVLYDFKYPNMSLEAYNALLKSLKNNASAFGKNAEEKPIIPQFVSINFNDLKTSARVNPIHPKYINSVANAQEIAKLLLTNLNRSWIGKESDFFNASAINLVAMSIYFLKLYSEANNKDYCTLPHVVELVNTNIVKQMKIYEKVSELRVLRSIFQVAIESKATDQLGGQVASALNSLAPLASKEVYWVLSRNDFNLEINNAEKPIILCLGSDRENKQIYGSLIAVIFSTIFKTMKKGNRPGFVMIDELPTIFLHDISYVINTIREIGVSVWLGIQDLAQLVNDYKREGAEVVMNACGSIFWGCVNFETAEKVSKIFGKTNQGKINISLGGKDDNAQYQMTSEVKDLLPPSLMTTLTPGRFAGKIADTFNHPIDQKLMYGDILVENMGLDHIATTLPKTYLLPKQEFQALVDQNYNRIIKEIADIRP